jgi:DNA-binding MarR family transcriptional regulator
MLEQAFGTVYAKFKLHFYKKVFNRFQDREANLTTVESFCMEIIHALDAPTVNEFTNFVQVSPPNAAYKVNSLIQKGYLKKVRSKDDRREYHLQATPKYFDYYNISYGYLSTVMGRIEKRFSEDEVDKLVQMLQIISQELMPEIVLPPQNKLPGASGQPG